MSYTLENGRLIIKNQSGNTSLDTAYGMLLCFGTVSGSFSLPARTTGGTYEIYSYSETIATGLNSGISFAMGHSKIDAGSYFTTAWGAMGGSQVVMHRVSTGPVIARYTAWPEIVSNTLYIKARQFVSVSSSVGQVAVSYRLALLGFAATS